MYHSLSSVTIGPYCIWLILFGGVNETEDNKDWQEQVMLANTAVVEIGQLIYVGLHGFQFSYKNCIMTKDKRNVY